jgi:hypothetical protein
MVGVVNWINLAQDRHRLLVLVSAVMSLLVLGYLSVGPTVFFSRRTLLHGMSYLIN